MRFQNIHETEPADEIGGFSILEMLVGLSLSALVVSLLLTGITQLRPIQERTEIQTISQQLTAAVDYVERVLNNHRNLALLENNPERTAFIGEQQRMRFVAVVSTGSDLDQLRDVTFDVLDVDGTLTLQQHTRPRRLSSDQDIAEIVSVISNLRSVQFEYLSRGGQWSSKWANSQRLPAAVRVTLKNIDHLTGMSVVRLIYLSGQSE